MPAIIAIASLAYAIYSGEKSRSLQKDQAEKQKQALAVQSRAKEAQERRKARIRQAQVEGSAGSSGVGGSLIEGGIAAINTGLEANIDIIGEQRRLGVDQINLSEELSGAAIDAQIAGAIGSFTSTFMQLNTPSTNTQQQPNMSTPSYMNGNTFQPNSTGAWGTGGFYGG